jgi:hypothetical protein
MSPKKIIRHEATCRCALCRKVDEIIGREGKCRALPGEPSADYFVTDPTGATYVWVPVLVPEPS